MTSSARRVERLNILAGTGTWRRLQRWSCRWGLRFPARARTAVGEERERLWRKANEVWRHYDEYAERTDREIPIVVLERI